MSNPTQRSRTAQVIATLLLMSILALALVGCGGGAGPSTSVTSPTNTPLPAKDINAYCNLLSVADVASITGKALLKEYIDPAETGPDTGGVCTYCRCVATDKGVIDPEQASIFIEFANYPDVKSAHEDIVAHRDISNFPPNLTDTDLTGIGDEAIGVTHITTFQVTFYRVRARKGSIVFGISTPEDPTPPIYSPSLDVDKQLAQMIDSKL